jgi:hypothetical protein
MRRRWPNAVERDFLYQCAKDDAALSDDQPYNAARASLWYVKWLDHKAADLIAEQAAARIIHVRALTIRSPASLECPYAEYFPPKVCEELEAMWPAEDAKLPAHILA